MTAIVILALIGVVGAGVDLSLLMSKRAATQDALDAATLYAPADNPADAATLKALTINAFNANVAGSRSSDATITAFTYDPAKQTVTATASGVYTPLFGAVLGVKQIPFAISSVTNRAVNGTVEVALVLDNTWSMSVPLDGGDTKINVLKTAADNLVATLMTPQNAGSVKVGVVPYAEYVNVGMANRSQPWLSVAADSTTTTPTSTYHNAVPGKCTTVSTKSTTTCTGGQLGTCVSGTADGVPTGYKSCWVVPQTCTTTTTPITPVTTCTADQAAYTSYGSTTTTSKWFGCVKNQVQGGKLMLPDPATPYVGIMEGTSSSNKCLSAIQPLTGTASVAKASVDGMIIKYPYGNYPYTYIPGGLVWGVNLLSPPAPFTEGAAYDPKNKMPRKAIVLMTDGANDDYLSSDGSLVASPGNALIAGTYLDQGRVCDYAKSKGIEVYTIGFGVDDPVSLAALQNCATDAGHYFDAKSSAALLSAFQTIAGSLSKVRIAH